MGSDSGCEEGADSRRDLCGMRFQRKVACVEEADGCSRKIALERFGTGWQEKRIVLAPHRQQRWPVGAEVALKSRVECDVGLVVTQQVELNLVGAWARQVEVVQRQPIRRNRRLVDDAIGVLPARRKGVERSRSGQSRRAARTGTPA